MRAIDVSREDREQFLEEFNQYPDCWLCGSRAPYYVIPQVAVDGEESFYPMICRVCRAHIVKNERELQASDCVVCLDNVDADSRLHLTDRTGSICSDCRDQTRKKGPHHAPVDAHSTERVPQ